MNYPQSLPLTEIKTVISLVKSTTVKENLPTFAHAAWVVQGYIQSSMLGNQTTDEVAFTLQSTENPLNILEKLVDETSVTAQANLPWALILRFIVNQLLEHYQA